MLNLPQPAQHIINTLHHHGYKAYAVGGSVRDMLINRPTKSWDFTTDAKPVEILNIFKDSFYDNQFGTVGIKIKDPESFETIDVYEITTFRKESDYSDKRHPDQIIWGISIEEDLARRDFTINAIAFDGKKIIDPYQGRADLEERVVRAVGDPATRFNEDALRLLRAVRIASQLSFVIDPVTFTTIQKLANTINNISADRIRQELIKIMESAYPADGVMLLKNSNLLKEILPELEQAFGIPQQSPKRHHIYDVGTHLVKSLENCPSKSPLVRFATLIHDIGKPAVFRKNPTTQIITFYNHEVVGTRIADQIARRLNFSTKDREKLITLVRWHQFTVDENQTDATLRRFIKRVGKDNLQDILDLRIGDRIGGNAAITSWRLRLFIKRLKEVQKQPFTVADLKADGYDVMKIFEIGPGPHVGKILDALFNEVISEKIKNVRELLLRRLAGMRKIEKQV